MIPKSVQRFSEKIMLQKSKLDRDDDSKKRHPDLPGWGSAGREA